MATFYANPNDENEPWIEKTAIEGYGFRIWHLMFFSFCGSIIFVIFLCFCVRARIPRTKQDIEADYLRKRLAAKFRERLRLIQNQDMDAMNLKRALEIIQEDYENENQNITDQFTLISANRKDFGEAIENENERMIAEPQQPKRFKDKISTLMKNNKLQY